MGLINKVRGEPRWTAWLYVLPSFARDALALLRCGQAMFLAVNERKSERNRWDLRATDKALLAHNRSIFVMKAPSS